jgi:hypothetical protein
MGVITILIPVFIFESFSFPDRFIAPILGQSDMKEFGFHPLDLTLVD